MKSRETFMEMAYEDRWAREITEMRRVLAGFAMKEECKWGKPTYTVDGKNVVIMQGFKDYFALGFFQGALLEDPRKLLVQLGQTHAARVMKFSSAKEIKAKAAKIKAYVREAIAVEKAGLRMKPKTTSDFPFPKELTEQFRKDARFKRAFEALTPGRQRSYLYHFGAAKQSATRTGRIEKAMPAIFEGRGFLERR
ncbi:MAG TPA: YdeI/OmpD-associated family protein [Gemmatimonadaceae bacterium]|nr:YdeI/OmpD-associated family protein [Gemmatimonadaceae bacterium]